ncbi:MAG: c-type cytochrome [Burkholderiaceae bacterium]
MITSVLMRKHRGSLVASVLLALAPIAAHSDSAVERGEASAAICIACHQADGNGIALPGANPWPRLAGLDPDYLANQLRAFKSGERQSAEMTPFATMLSDEQIDDVAAYYSSLEARTPESSTEVSRDVLDAGQKLARYGDWNRYIVPCTSCHGPDNQGVGSAFPDISGQHADYLAQQLTAWREGTRRGDPLGLMQAIAERMTDDDVTAVSAWLSTQPPADGRVAKAGGKAE